MTKISDFLSVHHTFLIDLSGVICNETGILAHSAAALNELQKRGSVFLLTNNTCDSPQSMSDWLKTAGVSIEKNAVISSGTSFLYDEYCVQHVYKKRVYVVGTPGSVVYLQDAGAIVTTHLPDADTVVIASSPGSKSPKVFSDLKEMLIKHPKPVICCNPDLYVRGLGQSLIPVAGYYAKWLETELKASFYWIGKPTQTFSEVVRKILIEKTISIDEGVCFFDDNPMNVCELQKTLGITGCWIKETGIGFKFDLESYHPKQTLEAFVF